MSLVEGVAGRDWSMELNRQVRSCMVDIKADIEIVALRHPLGTVIEQLLPCFEKFCAMELSASIAIASCIQGLGLRR